MDSRKTNYIENLVFSHFFIDFQLIGPLQVSTHPNLEDTYWPKNPEKIRGAASIAGSMVIVYLFFCRIETFSLHLKDIIALFLNMKV